MSDKLDEVLEDLINADYHEEEEYILRSTSLSSDVNGVVFVFHKNHKMTLNRVFNSFSKVMSEVIAAQPEEGKCILVGIGSIKDGHFTLEDKIMMSTEEMLAPNSEYIQ